MTRSTLFSSTAKKGGTGFTWLLLLFLALSYLPSTAHATYSLPASQSVDWTIPYIGVKGDIPARTTVYTTLSPSGGNDTSAIQTALKSCPAGQVVALTAGTFTISANINIPSNVTLRGAGKGVTTIAGASGMGGASLISFKAGSGYAGTSYTSTALAKGQTVVNLNAAPGWSVGALVLIDVANSAVTETNVTNVGNNGTCTWCGRGSGSRSMGQVNRVAAISGSTVTFETPLAWNFPPSATQFTGINSVTSNAGLENVSVNNQNSGSSSQTGNGGTIVMANASNCWLLGVEMNGSWLTMLRMTNTYGCTVRKCNLHEGVPAAFSQGCAAYQTSRAYGIWIGPGSNNLIEDNQLYHLAMPIKYDEPTSYNVLAYNVITNILYSPNPSWNQASIEFHGAHPVMNLFESNIVTGRLLADNVWGSSSHNTFFRNKTAISPTMTGALWDVCLQNNARNYNFIGNVLGTSRDESVYQINNMSVPSGRAIYQTGYTSDGDGSGTGNDANVATTLLTHGNWDSVTGGAKWLSGADQVLPASLYLKAMPSWWGSAPWPAIGPDVSPTFPVDAYSMPLGGANTPFDSGTQSSTPATYTISAGSTSGGSITPSGTATVSAGASQSYAITPLSGYSIAAVTVDGTPVGAVASYTFSSVGANHTISASFVANAPVTYSIAASAGAGGSITPSGTATVTSGGSASYTITPAAGYKISGVTVDGASVGAVSTYAFSNVTANHSISATFAVTSYSIAATAGTGGTITPSGTATLAPGGAATYSIAPVLGYTLSSVVVDGVSVGAVTSYSFSNVTANHTIQAFFVPKTFSIAASAGTGGSITPSGTVTVPQGSTATFAVAPATGYKISAVTVDGISVGAVSSYTFSTIGLNHTISAAFAPVSYTITASAGTGGSITPSGASSVAGGGAQTYSITPATGYKISGVTVDGASVGAVSSYSFSSIAANHTIAASFSASSTSTTGASYALNCAGAKYTDASGLIYNADAGFSGGSVSSTTAAISGTADATLYQSERYGNFSYSVPMTNGSYNVTLKFAEGYFSAAGQRIFNVAVNGATVISNLDIYAKAGKNTAYDVVVPATVSNGTLTIQFTSVVNNAEVRAIKIVPSTTATAPVFAVDAGGASYKAASGVTYAADSSYTGGNVGTTTATITGTSDGTLYQSERYGNFSYNVPVANGNYNVTLKFAEGYFSAAGQRVFNVAANGSAVISNLDIYAKAGKNAAYDVVVPVSVTNGAINLSFTSVVNNAEVRGILIQKM
jgi:hypothetical protein